MQKLKTPSSRRYFRYIIYFNLRGVYNTTNINGVYLSTNARTVRLILI